MKFGLRNGPWRTVFEGKFEGHEIEILTNPGQVMLFVIYEMEGDEVKGLVMQVFSLFSAVGEAETFIESLQKEAIILSRHDGKQTLQFLAFASGSAYAKADDEDVASTVDSLLKGAAKASSKLKGLAKSFDLHLTPLEKSSESVKRAFFSQPIAIPMLARERGALEPKGEEKPVETGGGGAVLFGVTKDGKEVKEPLQLFQRSLVTDGTLKQRIHVTQIIVESYLVANVPAIIFDAGNNFGGLSHPTQKAAELESHGVDIEPIGFPTKHFEPAKNIRVNLNVLSHAGMLQLFGSVDEESNKILAKAFEKAKVGGPSELIRNIDSLGGEDAENQFVKRRIERIISLMDKTYPEMFDGETNLGEITRGWYGKIGKASIVHVDKADPRILTMLLDSISNELINLFKTQGETGKPKLLFVVPEIEKVFSIRDNIILKDFIKMLAEMKRFGVSFVIGSERRTDLNREMLQIMETKAGVIKEDDVAIDLPNAKNYRILVRPTLSMSKAEVQ